MRCLIVIAALAASVSPAISQSGATAQSAIAKPVAPKRGATIFDGTANRLGTVLAVRDNGSVVIQFRSANVTVPAETLSVVNGKLTTSLTRAEVGKLN